MPDPHSAELSPYIRPFQNRIDPYKAPLTTTPPVREPWDDEKLGKVSWADEVEVQFLPPASRTPTPATRWSEVSIVFRGWAIPPCKTKAQNPRFHDAFFICA